MRGPWSNKKLQVLLGALVVVTALSTHGTSGKKPEAKGVPDAPATAVSASQAMTAGQPSVAPLPPAPSTPSGSKPAAPGRPREDVGRPNPFAPLVARQRPYFGPQGGLPPQPQPSRLGLPNATPTFGIDLPVPPGYAAPGGPAAQAPPPGAGMKVGAIIGGAERVAIIRMQGTPFVVGVGDNVGDAVVVEILEDKVVMRKAGVTFELRFGEGS